VYIYIYIFFFSGDKSQLSVVEFFKHNNSLKSTSDNKYDDVKASSNKNRTISNNIAKFTAQYL